MAGDSLGLTHGAGSNANAPLLIAIAREMEEAGVSVRRYNLPFRIARPGGPPRPSEAERDREGVRKVAGEIRAQAAGRVFLGGQSYGGRQTSMAAAEDPGLADGLLLLSYPLHPPGKTNLRTEHLPRIRVPVLFVQGTRDPFGSPEETGEAIRLIPSRTELLLVDNAGHDLSPKGRNRADVARAIAEAFTRFFA